jgi:hypothetical protein
LQTHLTSTLISYQTHLLAYLSQNVDANKAMPALALVDSDDALAKELFGGVTTPTLAETEAAAAAAAMAEAKANATEAAASEASDDGDDDDAGKEDGASAGLQVSLESAASGAETRAVTDALSTVTAHTSSGEAERALQVEEAQY